MKQNEVKNTNEAERIPAVPDLSDELPSGDNADDDILTFRLPDGYILNIRNIQSTDLTMAETADGFPIVLNPEGFYEYTLTDDQGLPQPSNIIARNPEDRSAEEWRILNNAYRKE